MRWDFGKLWNRQGTTGASVSPTANPFAGFVGSVGDVAGYPMFPPLGSVPRAVGPMPRGSDALVPGRGAPRRARGGVVVGNGYARSLGMAQSTPGVSAAPVGRPVPSGTGGGSGIGVLFGRPGFEYMPSTPAPRGGPTPKLSVGTGLTGRPDDRSRGPSGVLSLTGYSQDEPYVPAGGMEYSPPTDEQWMRRVPRGIGFGDDGLLALNPTYRAHEAGTADRQNNMYRSSGPWQDMTFGPSSRELLARQQAMRYNLYNQTTMARPLSPSDYFLGYQTPPMVAAQIGGMAFRPLGS